MVCRGDMAPWLPINTANYHLDIISVLLLGNRTFLGCYSIDSWNDAQELLYKLFLWCILAYNKEEQNTVSLKHVRHFVGEVNWWGSYPSSLRTRCQTLKYQVISKKKYFTVVSRTHFFWRETILFSAWCLVSAWITRSNDGIFFFFFSADSTSGWNCCAFKFDVISSNRTNYPRQGVL